MIDFPNARKSYISQHAEFLDKRGMTIQQGQMLGILPKQYQEACALVKHPLPREVNCEALYYFDIDGSPLHYNGEEVVRLRLHDYDGKGKYQSPTGGAPHAYLPRGTTIDWTGVAEAPPTDPARYMIGVEGELKAIKSCLKWEVPTVGLGGVWMFKDKSKTALVPPLNRFSPQNIILCYDAHETSTKERPYHHDVAKALDGATHWFRQFGWKVWHVHIARTPTFKPGTKMGLDDYIDAGGTQDELYQTIEEAQTSTDLDWMLDTFALKTSTAEIRDIVTGASYTVSKFKDRTTKHTRQVTMGNGGLKLVQVSQDFLQSKLMKEFDNDVFDPKLPWGYNAAERVFNHWRGFAVEPEEFDQATAAFEELLEKLAAPYQDYVRQWMAHMIQKPWERTNVALVMYSPVQGIGKSLLFSVLRGLIGDEHSNSIALKQLVHDFNAPVAHKLMLQVEEASALFAGHEAAFKDFITNPKILVTKKGKDSYVCDNFARVALTTNEQSFMRVKTYDRRLMVLEPNMTHISVRETGWLDRVHDIAELLMSPQGLAGVHWHLRRVSLDGFNPLAPAIVTEAMREVVESSKTFNESWVDDFVDRIVDAGGKVIIFPEQWKRLGLEMPDRIKAMAKQKVEKLLGGQVVGCKATLNGVQKSAHYWGVGPDNKLEVVPDGANGAYRVAPGQLGEVGKSLVEAGSSVMQQSVKY